jgi:hypothetical protein
MFILLSFPFLSMVSLPGNDRKHFLAFHAGPLK